jgi:hypothetical protein
MRVTPHTWFPRQRYYPGQGHGIWFNAVVSQTDGSRLEKEVVITRELSNGVGTVVRDRTETIFKQQNPSVVTCTTLAARGQGFLQREQRSLPRVELERDHGVTARAVRAGEYGDTAALLACSSECATETDSSEHYAVTPVAQLPSSRNFICDSSLCSGVRWCPRSG